MVAKTPSGVIHAGGGSVPKTPSGVTPAGVGPVPRTPAGAAAFGSTPTTETASGIAALSGVTPAGVADPKAQSSGSGGAVSGIAGLSGVTPASTADPREIDIATVTKSSGTGKGKGENVRDFAVYGDSSEEDTYAYDEDPKWPAPSPYPVKAPGAPKKKMGNMWRRLGSTPVGQYTLGGTARSSGATPAASSTGASGSGVTLAPDPVRGSGNIPAPHPRTRISMAARAAMESAAALAAAPGASVAPPPPAPPPPPEVPANVVQYGELLVQVPQVFCDHLYPHVDMLLVHQRETVSLMPRYIHGQSAEGTRIAHRCVNRADQWFTLMDWGLWEKGYENVPFTPQTRLVATWIWDMITFTLEMTFSKANLSQTGGAGLACASLQLQNTRRVYCPESCNRG